MGNGGGTVEYCHRLAHFKNLYIFWADDDGISSVSIDLLSDGMCIRMLSVTSRSVADVVVVCVHSLSGFMIP